jgi:hypothetical protein
MSKRKVLLVGSLPFDNEEDAMRRSLDSLGASLYGAPDGEIGEKTPDFPKGRRAAWVVNQMNLCVEDTDNWDVKKPAETNAEGFPKDYDASPQLRAKHPPSEMHKYLNFKYDEYFKESYEIFKRLRAERGLDGLKFQVGIPTGLGITFGMLGPINGLRYANAFNRRIAEETNRILDMAGDDVIIQVEVPAELAMAYRLPGFLMGITQRTIFHLLDLINPAPMGVHLCLGDLNNKALTKVPSLNRMVTFSNRLVNKWPQKHQLLYMHYPLAEAAVPPPIESTYYAPLKDIVLPSGVDFVAGFVHEKRNNDEHATILKHIEGAVQNQVGVACSCGLGRRDADIATNLIQVMHTLADQ